MWALTSEQWPYTSVEKAGLPWSPSPEPRVAQMLTRWWNCGDVGRNNLHLKRFFVDRVERQHLRDMWLWARRSFFMRLLFPLRHLWKIEKVLHTFAKHGRKTSTKVSWIFELCACAKWCTSCRPRNPEQGAFGDFGRWKTVSIQPRERTSKFARS